MQDDQHTSVNMSFESDLYCEFIQIKIHSTSTVSENISHQLIIYFNFLLYPVIITKFSMISELQCLMDNTN